jgi:DnaJ domain
MHAVDPFDVLGLPSDASAEQAAAAYRRLAKRWHPDVGGGDAARRMVEINIAYDLLRSGAWQGRRGAGAARRGRAEPAPVVVRRPPGAWLPAAIRHALGGELVRALEPDEQVVLVTPAATWASPQTLLALTDRRLLWLLDDAPTNRVRSLRLAAITRVESRLRRPLRRVAAVRVHARGGAKHEFSELRPATASSLTTRLGAIVSARAA